MRWNLASGFGERTADAGLPSSPSHGAAHETVMNPRLSVQLQPVCPRHEHVVQPPSETQLYEGGDPAGPPVIVEQYWSWVHVAVPQETVVPL